MMCMTFFAVLFEMRVMDLQLGSVKLDVERPIILTAVLVICKCVLTRFVTEYTLNRQVERQSRTG